MKHASTADSGRKKRLGTILFILFNVIVIGITAYFDFGKSEVISEKDLLDMNPWYLLAVAGCFVTALAAETGKYYIMLRRTTGTANLRTAFEVAALGKYYDNITPLGAGGQPFQAVYLHRSGIDSGTSAAVPVAGFLSLQGAFILLAAAVLIFGGRIVDSAGLMIPAYVGLLFYLFIPLAIIFFAISPSVTERVLRFFIQLFAKLRLIKHPEEKEASFIATLHDSIVSMSTIFKSKFQFLEITLLSLLFQISLCSMPYFVLRAFGNTLSFIHVFKYCIYIYLCITFIPTPGNSGAAEGSFYALFSVLGQGHLFWAMLVWRFFCYYMFIITGFAITIFGRRKKEHTLPDSSSAA